ncbi:hypothetical protein Hs20B_17910 [Lactococcus insecticola]|uniref:Uncharacterized protein n=1 Tax=Pseudolactococcus insecticola TaxID=2709158 RepID=A0A6A0B9U5_9LACT|nr:hypothetical protein Hs20B_17910 [Lactococcus insecticola]
MRNFSQNFELKVTRKRNDKNIKLSTETIRKKISMPTSQKAKKVNLNKSFYQRFLETSICKNNQENTEVK